MAIRKKATAKPLLANTTQKISQPTVAIRPPRFKAAKFKITGTAPYVQP